MSEAASPVSPARQTAEGLPCNFAQFLVSLGSSAMVHLGEMPDPSVGRTRQNLPLACHTLNLLRTLKAKTTGNLDGDESRLLDALIDELSSKYERLSEN